MNRITTNFLQAQVDRLNRLTGSPSAPWLNGKANIGCYHLSFAYGGVNLHRIHNSCGGVSTPVSYGHVTRRDLSNRISAFIAGYEAATTDHHKTVA